MTSVISSEADRALKAKHRATWASGDYPRVATDLIADLGQVVVKAAGISAGDRVLDVAAGSGNASIPAAETGASVVASDLTPELLAEGRRQATARGVELEWVEADVEALPFGDDEFDAVISVVGAMFAPHHQPTADEIVRVCKPGGTIAMINWTPEGLIGHLFKTMGPYAPPPPPGAQPPALWGSADHVRELFGDRVTGLSLQRGSVDYPPLFATAADLREYYKRTYGPIIGVYKSLAGDPDRAAALDRDFEALFNGYDQRAPGSPTAVWAAEYLLVTARKS
jgi:2-polyprenyl-6-hydroxyphenyl methylase/3-demethylubiquinone-9 3-methyltransferase